MRIVVDGGGETLTELKVDSVTRHIDDASSGLEVPYEVEHEVLEWIVKTKSSSSAPTPTADDVKIDKVARLSVTRGHTHRVQAHRPGGLAVRSSGKGSARRPAGQPGPDDTRACGHGQGQVREAGDGHGPDGGQHQDDGPADRQDRSGVRLGSQRLFGRSGPDGYTPLEMMGRSPTRRQPGIRRGGPISQEVLGPGPS